VNLRNNQLTSLPPEIGRLKSVIALDLDGNQLTSVPPEIGQLKGLTKLNLAFNRLTSLPPEIGRLKGLTALDLSRNRLASLPPEIGQLTGLTTLDLGGNQLTSLPPEIGRLTGLRMLNLNVNPLKDPPQEIIRQGTPKVLEYLAHGSNPGVRQDGSRAPLRKGRNAPRGRRPPAAAGKDVTALSPEKLDQLRERVRREVHPQIAAYRKSAEALRDHEGQLSEKYCDQIQQC